MKMTKFIIIIDKNIKHSSPMEHLAMNWRKPTWKVSSSLALRGAVYVSCFLMLQNRNKRRNTKLSTGSKIKVQKGIIGRIKENLKWRTDILDSCCSRPHKITGIVFDRSCNLEATTTGTSLIWSLAYEPGSIQSSTFPWSISKAFARTCFWVLLKLSNAKILA